MILIEDLTAFVLSLLIGIVILNVVFFSFVLWRRLSRQRFFIEKDAARDRYRPVIQDVFAGRLTPEQAVVVLSRATSKAEKEALAALLTNVPAENREVATLVLYVMGKVEEWAMAAVGKQRAIELLQFIKEQKPYAPPTRRTNMPDWVRRLRVYSVPRALAIDNLSQLAPDWTFKFCVDGLKDPAKEVRMMAIRGLSRTKLHSALPHLFSEMERCIESWSDLSLRGVKTALIEFSIDDLVEYTPYLTHRNHRFRFFVVDCAREICNIAAEKSVLNKNDFSPEFYNAVLDFCTVDEFADVRARSASIVKHFRDARATNALRKLLTDDNEFVRLHAVRACADRYYLELIPEVSRLMKDPKWRVRESAAEALGTIGGGLPELFGEFIKTADVYQSEQIAEHIQRGGLIPHVISELREGGDARKQAFTVCQKMAQLKKTSLLSMLLSSPHLEEEIRMLLIEALTITSTVPFTNALQTIVREKPSPALTNMAMAALQMQTRPGAKAQRGGA